MQRNLVPWLGLSLVSLAAAQTPLGSTHCTSEPNSTGARAILEALGQLDVAQNDLTLRARQLPPSAVGYALVSRQRDFVPFAGGTAGSLCLGPVVGRLGASTFTASASGTTDVAVDLTHLASPTGNFAAVNGDVLHFQLWYRDTTATGAALSNLSDGICVTFSPGPWLEGELVHAGGVASAILLDVDGDGDLDLATAVRTEDLVAVHFGTGDGRFERAIPVLSVAEPWTLALVDVDSDGAQDLLVGSGTGSAMTTFLARGLDPLSFEPAVQVPLVAAARLLCVGDFDADGNVDLVASRTDQTTVDLYFGDGAGGFAHAASRTVEFSGSGQAIDIDRDGDDDLVTWSLGNGVRSASVTISLSGGTFSPAVRYPLGGGLTRAVARDIDGDGFPDLVAGSYGYVAVRRNRGDGTFGPEARFDTPSYASILASLDLEGDGDLDLLVDDGYGVQGQQTRLWAIENLDNVAWRTLQAPVAIVPYASDLLTGDLDGQSPVDLVAFDFQRRSLRTHLAQGGLVYPGSPPEPGAFVLLTSPQAMQRADLDGDGDDELIVLDRTDDPNTDVLVALDLEGAVPTSVGAWSVPSDLRGFVPADMDGDGTLDFVYTRTSALEVGLVRGPSTLALGGPPIATPGGIMLAPADFDLDGDIDIVVGAATNGPGPRYYSNDGTGRLSTTSVLIPAGVSNPAPNLVWAVDVDGDGDADLVFARLGWAYVGVNFNLGPQSFAPRLYVSTPNWFEALQVGDVDADGDPDVVVDYAAPSGYLPRTLWNDGTGHFTQQSDWPAAVRSYGRYLSLADLEGDGDADLALLSHNDGVLAVARGDGRGGLEEVSRLRLTELAIPVGSGDQITLADLDGDGDAEVAWRTPNGVRIARNECR